MEKENNIVYDSYYLINLFNNDGKDVTQLQIQKLMYFFEAYYMNEKKCDKLYDCNFNAWMFGPVAIPLYKEYKQFGEYPIKITKENIEKGNKISKDKKEMLEELYRVFKNMSATQLVNLTHMVDSPWYKKWKENGMKVVYGESSYINKAETKEWFRKYFIVQNET